MKKTHLRADSRTNTFMLICKKVAKASEKKIENITAKSLVPEKAFNSLVSRQEVQKLLQAMPSKQSAKVEWRKDLTAQETLEQLWPKKKK
ncbi:MAG: hypothetical protein WCO16_02485 [bacterium]